MPQLLINPLPISLDTARQRAIRAWLCETPLTGFTDLQGNAAKLTWDEYTDVNPASGSGNAAVSSLATFPKDFPNYKQGCGGTDAYLMCLRLTVAMQSIGAAREVANDIKRYLDERVRGDMTLKFTHGGSDLRERYKFEPPSNAANGWAWTQNIKSGDCDPPGGTVTGLRNLMIVPCP